MSAFLPDDLGQDPFPYLFQLLEITCIPWWPLPISKPAMANQVIFTLNCPDTKSFASFLHN